MSITGAEFKTQYPGQMYYMTTEPEKVGLMENNRWPFIIKSKYAMDNTWVYDEHHIVSVTIPDDAEVTFGWSDGLPGEERIWSNKIIVSGAKL